MALKVDELKGKIMAKVGSMSKKERLQEVLDCVEKIIAGKNLVNTPRASSSSSAGPSKKRKPIVIDDDEPSQMSKVAGHGGSRGPERRGFLHDRSKLAPMAWSDIELQGKRDRRYLYVGMLARSNPPGYRY
jgi:hypothetical protein